ncbi:hypothetical protein BRW62_01995 [Parathermosynechococcus lividus PCC 6715]|uniref:Uncharacterized protein n=1 Tax=Parathermosynechococcus lividus PCC 6715 TaxID=1917166 RepID=A0A2D2PZN8_PARLV|nr:hypothetical protein BRW62_01995 [Thermostichus lividus PCC 6715]
MWSFFGNTGNKMWLAIEVKHEKWWGYFWRIVAVREHRNYRSDVGGLKPLRFSEGIQPTQGALAPSKVNYSCPELQCSAELFRC